MMKPSMIRYAVVALLLAACGGSSTPVTRAAPTASASLHLYQVGETVHGPQGVNLKVTATRVDPPGDGFPYEAARITGPGRWVNAAITIHNAGAESYGSANFVFDLTLRDSAGHSYWASGPAPGDAQLTAPVLPGETVSGWMRYAVPAAGSLRLLWDAPPAEVALVG